MCTHMQHAHTHTRTHTHTHTTHTHTCSPALGQKEFHSCFRRIFADNIGCELQWKVPPQYHNTHIPTPLSCEECTRIHCVALLHTCRSVHVSTGPSGDQGFCLFLHRQLAAGRGPADVKGHAAMARDITQNHMYAAMYLTYMCTVPLYCTTYIGQHNRYTQVHACMSVGRTTHCFCG